MMWVRDLAPPDRPPVWPGRTVIIYTASAITGFLASSLAGAFLPFLPRFLGAPASPSALGADLRPHRGAAPLGRRGGSSVIGQQAKSLALTMLLFGFVMPGVDNWATSAGSPAGG